AALPVVPLFVGHLRSVRLEPRQVLDRRAMDPPALEEPAPPEHGMGAAETDEPSREVEEPRGRPRGRPREPRELAVLAIGVVVAALGPPELVAPREHGHSLREEKGGEEVPLLPLAEGAHGEI